MSWSDDINPQDASRLRRHLDKVRKGMHEYDVLGRKSAIGFEPPSVRDTTPLIPSFTCHHGIIFSEPCSRCGRISEEDLRPYRQLLVGKVRELLIKMGEKL